MGSKDGIIIATIITTHMPRNDVAATGHVCLGILIHAMDIVHPPGIGIAPIADIDLDQTIVTVALAKKTSIETPKKARWEARAEIMIRNISQTLDRANSNHGSAQRLPYSSWRRSQLIG